MQKNVPKYTPDFVQTVEFWAETSKRKVAYALCNDRRTLLWFANQRAVEYHPTLVTVDRPDHVTHVVLDADEVITELGAGLGGDCSKPDAVWCVAAQPGAYALAMTLAMHRDGDGGATLSVRDSGYGIPAAHLPRITERFYRVSTSRSRESGGTGLGLAIVKHVLGLHGARLEISSEVGKGSTFACRFHPERVFQREPHPIAATSP